MKPGSSLSARAFSSVIPGGIGVGAGAGPGVGGVVGALAGADAVGRQAVIEDGGRCDQRSVCSRLSVSLALVFSIVATSVAVGCLALSLPLLDA